jgi:hypothetical protein
LGNHLRPDEILGLAGLLERKLPRQPMKVRQGQGPLSGLFEERLVSANNQKVICPERDPDYGREGQEQSHAKRHGEFSLISGNRPVSYYPLYISRGLRSTLESVAGELRRTRLCFILKAH